MKSEAEVRAKLQEFLTLKVNGGKPDDDIIAVTLLRWVLDTPLTMDEAIDICVKMERKYSDA